MVALSARRRALSLVPVAALSAAWTVGLSGEDPPSVASAPVATESAAIPDAVVGKTVVVPASATVPDAGGRSVKVQQVRSSDPVLATPERALVAYQRAAAVITASDSTCGLDWSLLAALGEVESDHGRTGAEALDPEGERRPALFGTTPTGIADTDGGEYDDDPLADRGIGPLRLVPAAWSSVKVDGDGDGARDPQDLDDAALAAAVHLCSGQENLVTESGRRAALLRYNPAPCYAALVLGWAEVYAVPTPTTWYAAAPAFAAVQTPARQARHHARAKPVANRSPAKPAVAVKPAKPPKPDTPKPERRPDPVGDLLAATGTTLFCTLDGLGSLLQPGSDRTCTADRPHRTTDR